MNFLKKFWTRLTGGDRSIDTNGSAAGGAQPHSSADIAERR
jgi:hypothetical protein